MNVVCDLVLFDFSTKIGECRTFCRSNTYPGLEAIFLNFPVIVKFFYERMTVLGKDDCMGFFF